MYIQYKADNINLHVHRRRHPCRRQLQQGLARKLPFCPAQSGPKSVSTLVTKSGNSGFSKEMVDFVLTVRRESFFLAISSRLSALSSFLSAMTNASFFSATATSAVALQNSSFLIQNFSVFTTRLLVFDTKILVFNAKFIIFTHIAASFVASPCSFCTRIIVSLT